VYRDDLAATHARVEQLQRELASASSQGVQDKQRIAGLTAQLSQLQQALSRMQQAHPGQPGFATPGYQNYMLPSRSSTILTLGILSLVVCSVMGPIAWSMGNEELRRIDAGQASPMGRGSVTAGRICGIIATSLLVIGGFFMLVVFALASGSR
jgi:hypothetical protein